jgi:hypothetical protein
MMASPISPTDKELLRRLAARVREIAELPEQKERLERWCNFNALKPHRPMVLCFPEGAWTELLPQDTLQCRDPLLRAWEWDLKARIYWWEHIHDDNIMEPYFNIQWNVDRGTHGVDIPKTHGADRGSYVWDPPLKDLAKDMAKLKFRAPKVDREATQREFDLAQSLFGDLLTVRVHGQHWWSMGLTWQAIELIGLENLMLYMYDQPAGLHKLMAWLRDEALHYMEWFEREGLLSLNNRADYAGSGGVGAIRELPQPDARPGAPARLKDLWGLSESQETVGVSPAMFGEFIFPYQVPLMEKFGLVCYGCCEGIHQRLDYILSVPNMRRISVSPWADQQKVAARLGKNHIFSRKPNPAQVCVSFDEANIRADLRGTLAAAGNGVLEIILKDTHTVQGKPERLTNWVQIALAEANRFAEGKK